VRLIQKIVTGFGVGCNLIVTASSVGILNPPLLDEQKAKANYARVDEGRKRVIGIMAAILTSLHTRTTDHLFGCPQGSPRTDKLIDASIQWAERIMQKIDERFSPTQ
jgi:hypothetical protein